MGRVKNGILDGFSGKVGTVIGSNWRGVQYIRARSFNRSNKNTPAQEEHRARFVMAVRFSRTIGDLLEISYRDFANNMTGANGLHSQIMKDAIAGTFPDLVLNHSKILIAKGSLALAAAPSVVSSSPETITFNWTHLLGTTKITEREKDKTILVAFSEPLDMAIYTIGAARRTAGTAMLNVPGFSGQDVHTWFSFIGQSGRQIANSVYTGKVRVQ